MASDSCPNCGMKRTGELSCAGCGIYFHKLEAKAPKPMQSPAYPPAPSQVGEFVFKAALIGIVALAGFSVLLRKAKALEASMPAMTAPVQSPPDFGNIKPIQAFQLPPGFQEAVNRDLQAAREVRTFGSLPAVDNSQVDAARAAAAGEAQRQAAVVPNQLKAVEAAIAPLREGSNRLVEEREQKAGDFHREANRRAKQAIIDRYSRKQ